MGLQQNRLSKKEKKGVAFRAREGKGKLGEQETLEVPIFDRARDGEDEISTQTTHQPRKHGDEKPVNKNGNAMRLTRMQMPLQRKRHPNQRNKRKE